MLLEVKFDLQQNDYMLVFCPEGKLPSYEKGKTSMSLNSLSSIIILKCLVF